MIMMAFISKGKQTAFVHQSKRKGLMFTTESVLFCLLDVISL